MAPDGVAYPNQATTLTAITRLLAERHRLHAGEQRDEGSLRSTIPRREIDHDIDTSGASCASLVPASPCAAQRTKAGS
jgi:hypothetical protein